jgi:hypothetical protein
MSDEKEKDAVEQFQEQMAEEAKFNDLKKEVNRKKVLIDDKRSSAQLEKMQQDERDVEILKSANFGEQTKDQISAIIRDNSDYIEAAMNRLAFIMKDDPEVVGFNDVVPFFRKNLLLLGAKTGDGKSTAVANIAYHLLSQKSPVTGKIARILVLTNEERKEDVYNRVTCLIKGWKYTNHDKLSIDQVKTFNKYIPILSGGGRLTVIDNNHEGAHGATTSIEGIEAIFENLLAKGEIYDCILIDYYQNITTSKRDFKLGEYEVQARLARLLDTYKNIYPAPIVLLAQVSQQQDDETTPFQYRIKGRKIIMDVCTFAAEMIVDRKNRKTTWTVWKSRFTDSVGEIIETGFKDGRFVPYTAAFKKEVQDALDAKMKKELDKQMDMSNGIPNAFKKKEETNE